MSVLCAVVFAVAIQPVMATPIPVRFAEGLTHGFLVLKSVDGAILAHGDLVQLEKDGATAKRMVFHFKDGSVYDENVTFTQRKVFALTTYRLQETGPAFAADTDISMTPGTGAYRVATKDHKTGKEKVLEGMLEMPSDVYNGLIMTVVKDLAKGSTEVIHYVAFTPQPRLIELELTPAGEQKIAVGETTRTAVHYLLKPRLGVWLKFFATILGRVPDDLHAWILTEDLPAFVEFEGSMTTPGPVWRIELVSPHRPE
jgi:hypothetical protein